MSFSALQMVQVLKWFHTFQQVLRLTADLGRERDSPYTKFNDAQIHFCLQPKSSYRRPVGSIRDSMFFLLTSVYKCTAASQSGRGQNYSSLAAEHLEHGWNGANLISPLELHLTTSELWFGQEQEGILP